MWTHCQTTDKQGEKSKQTPAHCYNFILLIVGVASVATLVLATKKLISLSRGVVLSQSTFHLVICVCDDISGNFTLSSIYLLIFPLKRPKTDLNTRASTAMESMLVRWFESPIHEPQRTRHLHRSHRIHIRGCLCSVLYLRHATLKQAQCR